MAQGTDPLEHRAPDASTPTRGVRRWLGFLLLFALAVGAGSAVSLHGQFLGERNWFASLWRMKDTVGTLIDPRSQFPGRDRVVILCVGLDRNIFVSRDPKLRHLVGQPYTKNARADVLMVVGLDLKQKTVGVLSIPRDTRVRLPGRQSYSKINEAHAVGGMDYTREAVAEFLGTPIDYAVVIRQEALAAVVDALGGVQVQVKKDMHYDDNWGQLHIHLKAGDQTLNGAQAVGYMRFRKDEEGDLGRIRRQQEVIQRLASRAKDPTVILKADPVIQAIREHVQTDLNPQQQLALAHLFHRMEPGAVRTVSLPIEATRTIRGVSYVVADDERKPAVVRWLLQGDPDGMNPLIRVDLRNASGSRATYQRVYQLLRRWGFRVVRRGRVPGDPTERTRVVQHSKLVGAGRRVLQKLGLRSEVEKDDQGEPGQADVTLYVGQDLVRNPVLAMADHLDTDPESTPKRTGAGDAPEGQLPPRVTRPAVPRVEIHPIQELRPAADAGSQPSPDVPGSEPLGPTSPAAPTPAPTGDAPSVSNPNTSG